MATTSPACAVSWTPRRTGASESYAKLTLSKSTRPEKHGRIAAPGFSASSSSSTRKANTCALAPRAWELLIDGAHALDRGVGIEQRKDESHELPGGHVLVANLVAGVQQDHDDNDGAQQLHQRGGEHVGADPAHVLTQQPPRCRAEVLDFEVLHPESLYHPVAAHRLLQDLIQLGQSCLALLH